MADKGIGDLMGPPGTPAVSRGGEMKTEYLVAEFGTSIVFTVTDIEADLGIQWEAVKDYWVKWGTLHLEMNDGVVHTVDGSDAETEFKRPREVLEYDAEWNGG